MQLDIFSAVFEIRSQKLCCRFVSILFFHGAFSPNIPCNRKFHPCSSHCNSKRMLQFPTLKPPTLEHHSQWMSTQCDELLLAQEEAELEDKYNEIRTANEGLIPIGKINTENDQDEFEADGDDDDGDNVEEESEGEDFEQETG